MHSLQTTCLALALAALSVLSQGCGRAVTGEQPSAGPTQKDARANLRHYVTRQKGTEPAFSGEYWNCTKTGTYGCAECGSPLFSSEAKYDSGTGWPSFYEPIRAETIAQRGDESLFMHRVEVVCSKCEAHLGHVFPDGPEPTGLRYCINSIAIQLDETQTTPK